MNYWHMMVHPSDQESVSPKEVKSILKNHGIIGMGDSWDNDRGQPDRFKNEMNVGDVVLVRSKGPLALVRVNGKCDKNLNSDIWFSIKREVEVLSLKGSEFKESYKKGGGNWTEGMYMPTTLETANKSDFIKYWYRTVKNNNIMDNCKLSDKRKQDIISLWKNYREDLTKREIESIRKEIDALKNDWEVYRKKLINGSLELQDYTNRKENQHDVPGRYLCNFLERTTKTVFGSSKPPGSAHGFEVKLNDDNSSYFIQKIGPECTYEEANAYYEQKIKPLFIDIAKEEDPLLKISLIEDSNYKAKQILRKLAVLDHLDDFLFIYNDTIDILYDEFLESNEDSNLGRNYELRQLLNHILEIDKSNEVDSVLLSWFIWKYSNAKSIVDDESPNVIFYGPPGTGKTYTVKNNLEFVCQGDQTRYKILQFHPSFTYEDFIEGIKPKGVVDGNIKFELVNGIFKQFCIDAKKQPEKDFYFVVDEINRANLSTVFGETLMCLESNYRHNPKKDNCSNLVKTQYSTLIEDLISEGASKDLAYDYNDTNGARFGVPNNVFFIGMMNDVDKSIDTFDLALRRRFKWIRKDCNYDVIQEEIKTKKGQDFENIESYSKACQKLNNYISEELGLGKSYEFGHSFFMKISDIAKRRIITETNIENLFNLYLRPTLKEYLRALFPEKDLDVKLEIALSKFKAAL